MNLINHILKASLVLTLSVLIIFQSSKDVLVLAWYEVYQESIIQEYCINIDKPEMMCNAKCHLEKLLSSNDSNLPQDCIVSPKTVVAPYIMEVLPILDIVSHEFVLSSPGLVFKEEFPRSTHIGDVFHPPRV